MGNTLIYVTLLLVLSTYVASDDHNGYSSLISDSPDSNENSHPSVFGDKADLNSVNVAKVFSSFDAPFDKVLNAFFKKIYPNSISKKSKFGSSTTYFPRKSSKYTFSTTRAITTQSPSTPVTVNCPKQVPFPKPVDCEEVRRNGHNTSGIYTVWPRSRIASCSVAVYCDMDTAGGGWTVIQRRGKFGGPMNFFAKNWRQYANGFGLLDKEFWLGNDNIFALTNQGQYSVRFDLQQKNGGKGYALYDTFWVDDELQKYRLHIEGYSGTAGDSMAYHNGNYFSTRDNDNDRSDYYNCANDRSSGWWFNFCMECNLNGLYRDGHYYAAFNDGIDWHAFGGYKNSLIATEIKILPRNTCRRRASLRSSKDL